MNNAPIRLAIVGSGNIANTHAEAIRRVDGARLVAVCSRNAERAGELAGRFDARVFASVGALLATDEIDAVLVATPSGVHQDSVITALRSGLHVLCEKPLEINTDRIANLIRETGKSGRILGCFFPLRCGAGAQAVRKALDEGRFGRLTFLSARVKWWRDQQYYNSSSWRGTWDLDGGGALMNQGIHAVDLLQWFGGRPVEVTGFSGTLAHHGIEVEDALAASVRFSNGSLGSIEAATSCYPGLDFSIEVSGDAGTAILVNDKIDCWRFRDERDEDQGIRSGNFGGIIHGGASDPKAISCEGHRQQIVEFCKAIRGEPANLIDGREAASSVAIVETIYRSTRSGQTETVNYLA